jgi:N-acetylglucosamine kinase-like BadF-type ATPase
MRDRTYIGIECVGMSLSVSIVTNAKGQILAAVREPIGLALHTTPRKEIIFGLMSILQKLTQAAKLSWDDVLNSSLCIGLTGATFPCDWHVTVPGIFETMGFKTTNIYVTGDAEIIYAAHAGAAIGGLILCHCGSTAYLYDGVRGMRLGGWGPLIGDAGSGYWMGRSALMLIAEKCDRHEDVSELWECVNDWLAAPEFSLQEIEEAAVLWRFEVNTMSQRGYDAKTAIFPFFHSLERENGLSASRKVVSSLVPAIMKAWRKGDESARQIITEAASLLANQFILLANRRQISDKRNCFKLVLHGGCINNHLDFKELVVNNVRQGMPERNLEIVTVASERTMRPVCGAALLAFQQSNRHFDAADYALQLYESQRTNSSLIND